MKSTLRFILIGIHWAVCDNNNHGWNSSYAADIIIIRTLAFVTPPSIRLPLPKAIEGRSGDSHVPIYTPRILTYTPRIRVVRATAPPRVVLIARRLGFRSQAHEHKTSASTRVRYKYDYKPQTQVKLQIPSRETRAGGRYTENHLARVREPVLST